MKDVRSAHRHAAESSMLPEDERLRRHALFFALASIRHAAAHYQPPLKRHARLIIDIRRHYCFRPIRAMPSLRTRHYQLVIRPHCRYAAHHTPHESPTTKPSAAISPDSSSPRLRHALKVPPYFARCRPKRHQYAPCPLPNFREEQSIPAPLAITPSPRPSRHAHVTATLWPR